MEPPRDLNPVTFPVRPDRAHVDGLSCDEILSDAPSDGDSREASRHVESAEKKGSDDAIGELAT